VIYLRTNPYAYPASGETMPSNAADPRGTGGDYTPEGTRAVAATAAGPATEKRRHRGAGQQDGAHDLGAVWSCPGSVDELERGVQVYSPLGAGLSTAPPPAVIRREASGAVGNPCAEARWGASNAIGER